MTKIFWRRLRRFFCCGETLYYDPWLESTAALAADQLGYRVVEVRMTRRNWIALEHRMDRVNDVRARLGLGPLFGGGFYPAGAAR